MSAVCVPRCVSGHLYILPMTSSNTARDHHHRRRPPPPPQALPPIRTFLREEISLPLPPSPWERHHHHYWSSHRDSDRLELQLNSPSSRPRAFTFSSPHLDASSPSPPRTAPLPTRRSFPPSSRPHRSASHSLPASAPVAPPAYAYNVLRPSRSGGALITSVPTVRARSRSMPQPPSHQRPSAPTSSTSTAPASRAESEGARRHVCPICQKRFNRPSSLRTHTNMHTGERPFRCPQPGCDKVFSVMSNMRRHQQRVHGQGSGDDDGASSLRGGEVDSDGDVYMEELEYEGNYEWAAAYEGPGR